MNKQSAVVLRVYFNSLVLRFDFLLVEPLPHSFHQLPTTFTRDYFYFLHALLGRLFHEAQKRVINRPPILRYLM